MYQNFMNNYKEVFFYFLRLGSLGFGGPLALVSNMQNYAVEEKKWVDHEEFNSTFALIKAMPGPIAFMTAVFIGRKRAGFWGGLLAGVGLNLPAFFLMVLFSLFFSSISHIKFVHILMIGMQASALGVILGSLKGLVKGKERNIFFWILVLLSGIINYFHPALEPVFIIGFGLMMITGKRFFDLGTLALVCFKAGALVFGSGLAIVPMLQHDVVERYHWLTQNEFLDALAFGQMTPGPVVITATYIGHKLYGMPGAVVATVCMFAAAFFHMSTWFPRVVGKLKGKSWINDFIFGAIAAVVGPILVAVFRLGLGIQLTPFLGSLFVISFFITLKGKFPLWAVIPMGGIITCLYAMIFPMV
ncbi:MAG: chromate transporter [Bdellovibrionales bacterium]|nr:chromate transporter [Bdellovibrionales bacterium]